jgi:hypothetical protein
MQETLPRGKTAIIAIGGGMRSARGAGFLYTLGATLKLPVPDLLVGTSGSAASVLYFASGQYETMRHIWTEMVATPEFISHVRVWRMMDVNYLIDTILKVRGPLDVEALKRSPSRVIVPILNIESGVVEFADAQKAADPFELLRAAKALPFFFGQPVKIGNAEYTDGELGLIPQDLINYVASCGASRVLLLDDSSLKTRPVKFGARVYARVAPANVRDVMLRDVEMQESPVVAPAGMHLLRFKLDTLFIRALTSDRRKVRRAFDRGVGDALAHEQELRTLFE